MFFKKVSVYVASVLSSVGILLADTPRYEINCDFQQDNPQFQINGRALNTPVIRAYTFLGTNVFNPSGYNAYFSFGKDSSTTNMVITTGTVYSTYVDFKIGSNTFARPVKQWYAAVMLTKPAEAGTYSMAYGQLNISSAPEVNANATFFYTRAINGSEYGPFTGSFTNWPFALSGDYAGYVEIAKFNATNAIFEGRISTNETFRTTTQPNTNALLQSQITDNLTNQNASNTIFLSWHTAQGNTNAGFESRIAVEEALFTAQGLTNVGFQALHDAQVNTNAGFETRIVGVETGKMGLAAQNGTNVLLQSQITANLTNQNATNTLLQSQITANTTGKVSLITYNAGWPAVSNTVIGQAANGQTAYGWGNHASAGYLTATQGLYANLSIGDRSKLTTNLSDLAQGTYTGHVISVAYTGYCEVARGSTYAWGFTKQNSFGTGTLSLAGFNLSATAAGVVSNYFSPLTTSTQIVLRLDGDGSSKSDVSGVYVKQITNGNLYVAHDIYVGNSIKLSTNEVTNEKIIAWDIAGSLTGDVADLKLTTNALNTRLGTAETDINNLELSTNNLSGRVSGMESNTGKWETAYLDASSATGDIAVIHVSTGAWTQAATDASTMTNWLGTNTLQSEIDTLSTGKLDKVDADYQNLLTNTATAAQGALADSAVQPTDADYTNAVALAGSALQPGDAGTTTNLSDYNNDVPFLTNEPVFEASAAAGIVGADTNRWNTGATDASAATNDIADLKLSTNSITLRVGSLESSTGALNIAVGDLENATNDLSGRVSGIEGWPTNDWATSGATNITAGDADSYNAATRTLSWNTNAAVGVSGTNWSAYPALQNPDINNFALSNVFAIDTPADEILIGRGASASSAGSAVGKDAGALDHGAAFGYGTHGSNNGSAFGYGAEGNDSGAAMGYTANANDFGAAIGRNARGEVGGVGLGSSAKGTNYGVGIGYQARGNNEGVAVGHLAWASNGCVAIGQYVTNDYAFSTRLYGNLLMGTNDVLFGTQSTTGRLAGLEASVNNIGGEVTNALSYIQILGVEVTNTMSATNYINSKLVNFSGTNTTGFVTSADGDDGKFLKGDGTWDTPAGAGDFLADGSVPMTGNFNGGGQDITNVDEVVATTFTGGGAGVTGVNATNATTFDGQTTNLLTVKSLKVDGSNADIGGGAITNVDYVSTTGATTKVVYQEFSNGSTNTTPFSITGVGFRPKGASVYAALDSSVNKASGFGVVDSAGTASCLVNDGSSAWGRSASFIYLGTSAGQNHKVDWSSWDADGATFTRSKSASMVTNDVKYIFQFFR